jgi:hypothetical protein
MTMRFVATIALTLCLARSSSAAETPCPQLARRVGTLRSILDNPWLSIRPELVRKAWYRKLDEVPTACHSEFGCLFLGYATVLPGSAKEPSVGDCSESFTFNPEARSGPRLLTGASLDQWFGTLEEAQAAATTLAAAIKPSEGACVYMSTMWTLHERSRECAWAADGGKVIAIAIQLLHIGRTWGASVTISREGP